MTRARTFMLGSVAAGIAWGSVEVLWTIVQPLLQWEILRAQLLLPPRHLTKFFAVAAVTYGSLGAIIGATIYAGLRGALSRRSPITLLTLGAGLTAGALGSFWVVVWVNMLIGGELLQLRMLLFYGAGIALILGVIALGVLLIRRLLDSAMVAAAAIGLLIPGLLLGAAALAHREISYPDVPAPGMARDGLPNIIMVTIDTLRADHVGVYSDGKVITPTLDRYAREGVRFEWAISHIPHTTPSHVSIFSSTYPFVHGARNGIPMRLELKTLPQILKTLGYHTAAFTAAYTTRSNVTGLGTSFDLYVDSLNAHASFLSSDEMEPLTFYRFVERLSGNQIAAPTVNKRVRSWLASRPPEPFFVWVHYFDPHGPFAPSEEYRKLYSPVDDSVDSRKLALYAAEVTYTDEQLRLLLEDFRAAELLEDALVVVTSDHGEAFGEPHPHVDRGHGRYLYDSVLRVPLIFWYPSQLSGNTVVDAQVESIDIAPTLLDLIGAAIPDSFQGRSLRPLLEGKGSVASRLAFSETSSFVKSRWYSIRSREAKLLVNPTDGEEQFFDLRSDPLERVNLIDQKPRLLEEYRSQLSGTLQSRGDEATLEDLSPETIRQLRALGYLDGEEDGSP